MNVGDHLNFSHGCPWIGNISLLYTDKGVRLVFDDLDLAIIDIDEYRFYQRVPQAEVLSPGYPYLKFPNGINFVIDKDYTWDRYRTSRLNGLSLPSVLDVYIFIFSLFTIPEFYYRLFSDRMLKSMWSNLFSPQDLITVNSSLASIVKRNNASLPLIFDSLKGITLRLDAASILLH